MGGMRRKRVEPTNGWEQIEILCRQLTYEENRSAALFGSPVSERAEEKGTSEETLPQGLRFRLGGGGQPLRRGRRQAANYRPSSGR